MTQARPPLHFWPYPELLIHMHKEHGWNFSQTQCILLGIHPSEYAVLSSCSALSFPLDVVSIPLWEPLICEALLDLFPPVTLVFFSVSSNSLSSFPLRDLCTLTFLHLTHSYFYSPLRSPLTYNLEKHTLIPHLCLIRALSNF